MQARDRIRDTAAYVVTDNVGSIKPKLQRKLVHVFRHRRGFVVALSRRRPTDASQIQRDDFEFGR